MTTTTYTTKFLGQTYSLRADFAQASSQIEHLGGDGQWHPQPMQVADYRHRPAGAMRHLLEQLVAEGGDSVEDYEDEIADAVAAMTSDE